MQALTQEKSDLESKIEKFNNKPKRSKNKSNIIKTIGVEIFQQRVLSVSLQENGG